MSTNQRRVRHSLAPSNQKARLFQFRESNFFGPITGRGLFQFLDKLRPHSAIIGNCPRAPNGTLILRASREAEVVEPQKGAYRAKPTEEVEADAPPHVVREGGDVSNDALILSRYLGRTFLWLLENDVGYVGSQVPPGI
ncbi:hypothetical protein GOODEAATRI_027906 [Goodea atripinnis]|uniref:Uncharacterized protein n=1 Tax=Goodea atripinnis TaxID=208336 RepID=A0ABV0MVZ4_9TELE